MMKPLKFDANCVRSSAKESYLLPQPEGVVRVQDYLFTEIEGTRCVLLRWVMEADFPVDSFTFVLTESDAAESDLGTTTVTCGRADVASVAKGAVFTPASAIPVGEKCTAVKIQLTEVVSGDYVYTVKGTRVEAGYRAPERWVYDKNPGREDGLSDKRLLRVVPKRRKNARFLWIPAVLTAILLILMILDPYVTRLREETAEDTAADGVVTSVFREPSEYETGVFYPMDEFGTLDVYEYAAEPTEDVQP